jgi:RNA polymerase sigma-70 factor (ECF subfamily)
VLSETFLVAWRRLDDLPSDVRPWLIGIARNVRLNLRRSARRQNALTDRLAEAPPSDERHASLHEGEAVRAALAKLREPDREVLLLSLWDDLDRAAIAQVLGCSKGNVSLRLHRARRRLAAELAEISVNNVDSVRRSLITGGASDVQ